jgi:ADP-ribose pyrophosphatase
MTDTIETLVDVRRFQVVKHSVTRPDGTPASVSYVVHPGSVAILPLVDADHLCLIRSRRLTVGQTLVEVPAGTREPGEPPSETARRELEEETGYSAAKWEELTQFYASPGILSERMHIYVASELTAGEPRREPNEEIENLVLSWDEALAMIDRGEIIDGKTMVALLLYERRRSGKSGRSEP